MDAVIASHIVTEVSYTTPVVNDPPIATSSLQFARSIETLNPLLVEHFKSYGISLQKSEIISHEFIRMIATIFYTLEIQPNMLNNAWSIDNYNSYDKLSTCKMALHAILPDMVNLCVGKNNDKKFLPKLNDNSNVADKLSHKRLMVLAGLIEFVSPLQDSVEMPISESEELARSLVFWAKNEVNNLSK